MTGIEENDFLLPGTKTEGYYKLVHYLQDFHKKFGGVDPDKIEDKEVVSLFQHGIEIEDIYPSELILDDFPGVLRMWMPTFTLSRVKYQKTLLGFVQL